MPVVENSKNIFVQAYLRGLVVLLYGLACLGAGLAGYLFLTERLFVFADGLGQTLLVSGWAAALAGAIGGVTAMLSYLGLHVSIRQDFQEQSLLRYLLRPVIGLIMGLVSLIVITIPGSIIINFLRSLAELLQDLSLTGVNLLFSQTVANLVEVSTQSTFMAVLVLIAWMAGFHQQLGLNRLSFGPRRLKEVEDEVKLATTAVETLDDRSPLFYKNWVQRRQQLMRWTMTWGLFLLIYAMAWSAGLLALFFGAGPGLDSLSQSSPTIVGLIGAALPVAAAGGLGGVVNLLYDLYWHISVKQDFHRQHLMSYLVKPMIGFGFGLAAYFLLATGYLSLSALFSEADPPPVIDSQTVFMTQLALGLIAGFRQQTIADMTTRLLDRILILFRLIGSYFNPINLFSQDKREAIAAEIRQHLGIFEALNDQEGDTLADDGPSIWAASDY